jgi:hypothetical protein
MVSRAGLGTLDCVENRQVIENAKSTIITKVRLPKMEYILSTRACRAKRHDGHKVGLKWFPWCVLNEDAMF